MGYFLRQDKKKKGVYLQMYETLNVFVAFIPKKNNTFDYKVYNSKYKKGIWETDPDLNYHEKN